MLGWTLEHVGQERALEFLHPDDHQRAIANWLDFTSSQQTSRTRRRYRRSSCRSRSGYRTPARGPRASGGAAV
jgi:hypothetical protein